MKLVSKGAGFIRPPTFSTRCPRASNPKPSRTSMKSGWLKHERTPRRRSIHSWKNTKLKYSEACECLKKDRDVLLTFYDFPAEHWAHLRTTNPIESTFATIRLRHRRTKGCGSRNASLAMMFKLGKSAEKKWRTTQRSPPNHPTHSRNQIQRRNHAGSRLIQFSRTQHLTISRPGETGGKR